MHVLFSLTVNYRYILLLFSSEQQGAAERGAVWGDPESVPASVGAQMLGGGSEVGGGHTSLRGSSAA